MDEVEGFGGTVDKITKARVEGGFVFKGDDCKQGVAQEGQVLRSLHFATTVGVFTPFTGVATVVVAVLHSPVTSDRARRSLLLTKVPASSLTAQKVTHMNFGGNSRRGDFVNLDALVEEFFGTSEVLVFFKFPDVVDAHPGPGGPVGAAGIGNSTGNRTKGAVVVLALFKATVPAFGSV